jgi:phosphate transport system substrate-binding protein
VKSDLRVVLTLTTNGFDPSENIAPGGSPLNTAPKPIHVLVLMVAVATLLAACGSSTKSTAPTTPGATSGSSVSATIYGAGSSFQKTFDEAAIAAFQQADSKITVNYNPVGSGQGKSSLETKTVDFAGTDSLPKPSEVAAYQGGPLLNFPTVAAPITISYHLSGVSNLRLSGDTIAKIFSLKIKTWNDPAIVADNPGAKLPSTSITVAHRTDGSGTTANFTRYLTDVDRTDWTLGSGDTVKWTSLPGATQGGTKNAGVAQLVKSIDGAIGYVDLADATAAGLQTASVKNTSGDFIAPTVSAAAAALAGTTFNADLSYDPINASGATAYPITSPTWIIAYAHQTDHAKGTALKEFLQFIYTQGEGLASTAGYAALPASVVSQAMTQLAKIQIPA